MGRWSTALALLAAGILVSASTISADDRMYKCEDGTFTNRPELLCEPYEPKGRLLILPEGVTLNSVKALVAEPPAQPASSDRPLVCQLYDEWVALNLRTEGGHNFQLTQDRPRWIALSRIFTAIGAPACP